ncbi:hypothetical protein TWF106_001605 [Orbilia oligospora]|uniref:Uncharacterized protein n=1 Tax=Orbilia oligospora TaxID=2813651 RepID=A0A7C8QA94_ORBOL|nr:hypothetical protein TWF106_001605 [Orbilia oligospora]
MARRFAGPTKTQGPARHKQNFTSPPNLRTSRIEPPASTPSSNELHLPPAEKRRPSDPAKAFCQMPKVMKTEHPSPPTLLGEPPTSLGSAQLYSFHTLGFKGSQQFEEQPLQTHTAGVRLRILRWTVGSGIWRVFHSQNDNQIENFAVIDRGKKGKPRLLYCMLYMITSMRTAQYPPLLVSHRCR